MGHRPDYCALRQHAAPGGLKSAPASRLREDTPAFSTTPHAVACVRPRLDNNPLTVDACESSFHELAIASRDAAVSEAARAFAKGFPLTPLRIFVEGLGAGYQPVLEGRCTLGILASPPMDFASLAVDRLGTVPLVMVAARGHPLANFEGHIPKKELSKHAQLVLTDRSQLLDGRDYGVLSSTTWRLADLSTKYSLLKDCVGWGGMPLHMVEKDIASGDLVALDVDGVPRAGTMLTISAVYPAAAPPGPAGGSVAVRKAGQAKVICKG